MAGWSTQEMLDGVQSTLNLAKIGATDLGTASDILTKILVGLVEILFKKDSVNCWKAKLIFVIYGIINIGIVKEVASLSDKKVIRAFFPWDKEHRTDINNGVTLCKQCHRYFHIKYGMGDNTKEQYIEFINNKKENTL